MRIHSISLKIFLRFFRYPIWVVSPKICTELSKRALKKLGVIFNGEPNYLSALVWFDGDRYCDIAIGHGVTISSNVRILTHDWSHYTVARSILGDDIAVEGVKRSVTLGDYVFIGTGSIIMPGANIGKGSIVGAGTVVRGKIPDYSLVIGNPGTVVGDSRDIARKVYRL